MVEPGDNETTPERLSLLYTTSMIEADLIRLERRILAFTEKLGWSEGQRQGRIETAFGELRCELRSSCEAFLEAQFTRDAQAEFAGVEFIIEAQTNGASPPESHQ